MRDHHFTCVPKIMIRWCMVPEIWCATDGWKEGQTGRWMEKVTYRGGWPSLKIPIDNKTVKWNNLISIKIWKLAYEAKSWMHNWEVLTTYQSFQKYPSFGNHAQFYARNQETTWFRVLKT